MIGSIVVRSGEERPGPGGFFDQRPRGSSGALVVGTTRGHGAVAGLMFPQPPAADDVRSSDPGVDAESHLRVGDIVGVVRKCLDRLDRFDDCLAPAMRPSRIAAVHSVVRLAISQPADVSD